MIRHIVLVKTNGDAAVAQLEPAFQQIGRVVARLPGALIAQAVGGSEGLLVMDLELVADAD